MFKRSMKETERVLEEREQVAQAIRSLLLNHGIYASIAGRFNNTITIFYVHTAENWWDQEVREVINNVRMGWHKGILCAGMCHGRREISFCDPESFSQILDTATVCQSRQGRCKGCRIGAKYPFKDPYSTSGLALL